MHAFISCNAIVDNTPMVILDPEFEVAMLYNTLSHVTLAIAVLLTNIRRAP